MAIEDKEPEEAPKSLADMHREKLAKEAEDKEAAKAPTKSKLAKHGDDDEDPELDRERLKKALDAEKKRKKMTEEEAWQQTKKSKTLEPTQEEMEAYRLNRNAFEDPMANYKDEE